MIWVLWGTIALLTRRKHRHLAPIRGDCRWASDADGTQNRERPGVSCNDMKVPSLPQEHRKVWVKWGKPANAPLDWTCQPPQAPGGVSSLDWLHSLTLFGVVPAAMQRSQLLA